jgi:hypothetical protein
MRILRAGMRISKKIIDNVLYALFLLFYPLLKKNINSDLVVHLYVLCWNEEKMISYFIDYYRDYVDKICVYDNMSDDRSLELLSGREKVEVVQYDTGGVIDNDRYLEIKNNVWKASAGVADFVIVCDMDEFLYAKDIKKFFLFMKKMGYSILKPKGYEMCSDIFPEYDGKQKIVDIVKEGYSVKDFLCKNILFDPGKIKEINYEPGCHWSNPEGEIKMFYSPGVKLLHYDAIGKDYFLQKRVSRKKRLSSDKLKKGYSLHYNKTIDDFALEFEKKRRLKHVVI